MRLKFLLPRVIFVLLVIFVLFHSKAWAADFSSAYSVTYDFSDNGTAQVTQNITLTNHTADKYPADYTLTVGDTAIEEVSAFDALGSLELAIESLENNQDKKIKVSFNVKTVGVGSKLSWTLKYQLPNFAKNNGRMWEINIPLLKDQQDYQVTVKTPQTFGLEHFIKPAPTQKTYDSAGKTIYFFSTPGFPSSNLTFSFGNFQLHNFTLTYHLQNPTQKVIYTEIALLPDLYPYQRIYFKSLEPKPLKIREDADGNYLAEYRLGPQQKLEIAYQGQVKIAANPSPNPPVSSISSLQPYLLPAKFWEVNAEEIKNLLGFVEAEPRAGKSKIKNLYNLTSKSSQIEWTKAIYDYVTTTLKYNPERITNEVERFGAIKALQEPENAVCMEYTDLLITLLRAAGIPARELDGFAGTLNDAQKPLLSDSLHAWVQFFDEAQGGWVNIDPTWGSTSQQDYFSVLDTNHIIFVIKGHDSERPYPAGSYKITGEEQGDVKIEYAPSFDKDVIPFRLWWQKNFEISKFSLLDKICLWLSNLIHNLFH